MGTSGGGGISEKMDREKESIRRRLGKEKGKYEEEKMVIGSLKHTNIDSNTCYY